MRTYWIAVTRDRVNWRYSLMMMNFRVLEQGEYLDQIAQGSDVGSCSDRYFPGGFQRISPFLNISLLAGSRMSLLITISNAW
jgi:hypothetical protein